MLFNISQRRKPYVACQMDTNQHLSSAQPNSLRLNTLNLSPPFQCNEGSQVYCIHISTIKRRLSLFRKAGVITNHNKKEISMNTEVMLPCRSLKQALSGLNKLIGKRSTLPILGHVQTTRETNGLVKLQGTDLNGFATFTLNNTQRRGWKRFRSSCVTVCHRVVEWCALQVSNLRPLPCEGNALPLS